MRVIDLTHTICEDMPVYPGTEPPKLQTANTIERDGFRETLLTMYSHTGTHMDAPAHLYKGRITLDAFPVSQFIGKGLVINCSHLSEGGRITMEDVDRKRALADRADFLLFRTGWSDFWGTDRYFGDYPVVTPEVVDYLISSNKKGIGLDVIGIDPISDAGLSLHKRLFSGGDFVIIENLTNLRDLGEGLFDFFAMPLKFEHADGAPIRAIGILQD